MLPIAKGCRTKLFRSVLLPFLAAAMALSGCGNNGQPNSTIVVVTPYTPPPASGAISSTQTPQDLTRLQISVLDTSGRTLAGPSNFTPGQTASIDVESGSGRIVQVRGYDAASDMLYLGKSTAITLAADETRTVTVDLYGKLLKGSVNLTNAQTVVGIADGQTAAASSATIASDGSFRLSLPDGTVRPYLLYGADSSSVPVGAAIIDGPGAAALNPLTSFEAAVLANPLVGAATSPTVADIQTAWSGWLTSLSSSGSTQQQAIDQAEQKVQQAVGLTTLGISNYRIAHDTPTAISDLINYNLLTTQWVGGNPHIFNNSGGVNAGVVAWSPSTGTVTAGNTGTPKPAAVLTLPASDFSTGVTVANRTAGSSEWLLWQSGSTINPIGITPPTSIAAQPKATLGAVMGDLAFALTQGAGGVGIDPYSAGAPLSAYLTSALEQLVLQKGDTALYQRTLTNLQNTIQASNFNVAAPFPVASDAVLNAQENSPGTTITLTATSSQPASLTFAIPTQPLHGTASITGNQLTYVPTTYYNGSDSLKITATDNNGTSLQASVAINVTHVNHPPAPTAAGTIAANSGGSGTTTVSPNDPDAGDTHTYAVTTAPSSGTASVSTGGVVTYNAPSSFKGSTSLVVTVTDNVGATGTVTIPITVTDTTPPALTVPASITVAAVNGSGTPKTDTAIAAFLAGASATDNVDGVLPPSSITNNAPATFPVGTTFVTFTATDSSGRTASNLTASVTVQDQAPPVVTAPTNATIAAVDATGTPKTDAAIAAFLAAATATDNVDGTIAPASITNDAGAITTFPLGSTTTVTFSATDTAGLTGTATATVTITDQTGPVITVANATVNATSGSGIAATDPSVQAFLSSATATDNVDGTIAPASITNDAGAITTFPVGSTTVTFSAVDAAGNTGTATATLTVANQPPVVTNPGTQASVEGDVVALSISATSPGGQSLTYRAANLPAGLSIDSATGIISGTIDFTNASSSPFAVTVDVSDGVNPPVATSFTWNVTDLPITNAYGWTKAPVTTDNIPYSNTLGLSGHQFLDAEGMTGDPYTMWVVGSDTYTSTFSSEGVAQVTHDGGATWNRIELPSQQIAYGVGLGTTHEAYVLGYDTVGLPSLLAVDSYSQTVTQLPINPSFQASPLTGLNVTPGVIPALDTVWMAGIDFYSYQVGMRVSTDGGTTWNTRGIYPFTGTIPNMTEAFFRDNYGWVAIDNTIWRTTDAGLTWSSTATSATTILGIHFSDPLNGWAVGPASTLLRTTDGGVNWLPVSNAALSKSDLTEVFAVDAATAYVVSAQGEIFLTQDGGANWIPQVVDPAASGSSLAMIAMTSSSFGAAVGLQPDTTNGGSRGIVLQTSSGGRLNTGPISGTITAGVNPAPAVVSFVPVTDPMTGQTLGVLQQVIGSGSYSVELAPGQYQVVTTPIAGSTATTDPTTGGPAYLSTQATTAGGQTLNLLVQDGYTTPVSQNLTLNAGTMVSGTVRDEQGRGVPNATVYLMDPNSGSTVAQTMSDSVGVYAMAAPQGKYVLAADRAYTTFAASYRVDNAVSSGNSGAATYMTVGATPISADVVLLHRVTQPWSADLVEGDPTWIGVATAPRDTYGQPVSPGVDLYAWAFGSDTVAVSTNSYNRAVGDTLGVMESTLDGGVTWSRTVDPYTNTVYGVAPTQVGQGLYLAMGRDPVSGKATNMVVKNFTGSVVLNDPYSTLQTGAGIQAYGLTVMVPILATDPYGNLETGVIISEDGGTTANWKTALLGNQFSPTTVGDLDIVDPYTAFVTTDNTLWRVDGVGGTWNATQVNFAVPVNADPLGVNTLRIDFNSAQEGWAINKMSSAIQHNDVWHTVDGGVNWTQLSLPAYAAMTDIAALDPYSAVVTTASGGTWVTHDGGLTWVPSNTGLYQQNNLDWSQNFPAPNLRAVAAANPTRVFSVGGFDANQVSMYNTNTFILPPNGSVLLHSESGGLTAGQVVRSQIAGGLYSSYEVRFMPVVDPLTGQLLAQAQMFSAMGMNTPQPVTVQLQPGSYVMQLTDTMSGQTGWYNAVDPYGWTTNPNQATVVTTAVSAVPQDLYTIQPSTPGSITGTLTDAYSNPVAGWTITALPVADAYGSVPTRSWWSYNMAVTDPYGAYSLSVPAGNWRLAATPGDASTTSFNNYDYISDLNTQYWVDPYTTTSAPETSGIVTLGSGSSTVANWQLQTPVPFSISVLAGGVPQAGVPVMGRHDGRGKDIGPLDGANFGNPFGQDLALTNGSGVAQLSAPPTALLNILVGTSGGNGSTATPTWADRLTGAPYLPTWNGDTVDNAAVAPIPGSSIAVNMASTVAITGTVTGTPATTSGNDVVFAMPAPDVNGHYQGALSFAPWNASGQYHLDVVPGVYWVGAVVNGSFLYSTGSVGNSTRVATSAVQYTVTTAPQTVDFDVSAANSNSIPLSGIVRIPAGWVLDRITLTPTQPGIAPIEIWGNGSGNVDTSITRDIPFNGLVENLTSYYVGVAVRQQLVQQSDTTIAGTIYRYWDGATWHDAATAAGLPAFSGASVNLGILDLTTATWPTETLSVQVLHSSGYWGEGMTRAEARSGTGIVLPAAENNPSWNNPGPAWLDGVVQLPVDPGTYRIKYADRYVWTGNNIPAVVDNHGTTMTGNMTTNTDPSGTVPVTVTQGSGHQHLGIFRIP